MWIMANRLEYFSCYAKSPNHYYEHFTLATKSLCGKLWKLLLTVEINNIIIIDFLAVWMNDNNPSCHPYFLFFLKPILPMRDIMRGSYEGRKKKWGIKTKGLKHAIELTKKKFFIKMYETLIGFSTIWHFFFLQLVNINFHFIVLLQLWKYK